MVRGVDKLKRFKFVILGIFLVLIFVNLGLIFLVEDIQFIGNDIASTASVIFSIESDPIIYILSPENITYNFSGVAPTPYGPFDLNLSVSSTAPLNNWIYSLYDNKHRGWVYQNVAFFPNISFNAVRWSNTLFVNATSLAGKPVSANVTFYSWYHNTRPIIYGVTNPIYVCEGQQLDYRFYAIDAEEDKNPPCDYPGATCESLVYSSLSQNYGIFFPSIDPIFWNRTQFNFSINSGTLLKYGVNPALSLNEGVRNYSTRVEAFDGQHTDSVATNISVLEINNPPILEDVTVQTLIWNQGENSTFYELVDVSDVEYSLGHGNLSFNLSIKNSSNIEVPLFGITFNGTHGIINFTATSNVSIGVYNIRICANDTGILNPYSQLLTYCGQTGGSQYKCDDFSLTITNENRAPTIVDHNPSQLEFNTSGTNRIYFNITSYDPDGTIPDAYWFVDGSLVQYSFNNTYDTFNYTFGCGVSGVHTMKAEVTDGLLNDSVQWNITIIPVSCPSPGAGGGGGGGGGGGISCYSNWVCNPWMICQNTQISLDQGLLSGLNYRIVQEACDSAEYDERVCGFQIRECVDLNKCNSGFEKPGDVAYCLFSEDPSCRDGLKNCHDNSCELLVDCGGPCGACPSCSDGIRNQGEEKADCGGPCPWQCIPAVPLLKRTNVIYGFLILLLFLIIFIIYKLVRVLQYKRKLGEQRSQRDL